MGTLGARLSATDKALGDANARAAALNGQLVLAESEARLKAQELLARVATAEDGEKLAKVRHVCARVHWWEGVASMRTSAWDRCGQVLWTSKGLACTRMTAHRCRCS